MPALPMEKDVSKGGTSVVIARGHHDNGPWTMDSILEEANDEQAEDGEPLAGR